MSAENLVALCRCKLVQRLAIPVTAPGGQIFELPLLLDILLNLFQTQMLAMYLQRIHLSRFVSQLECKSGMQQSMQSRFGVLQQRLKLIHNSHNIHIADKQAMRSG